MVDIIELMKDMYIPEEKKDITKEENIRWLIRNMGIKNSKRKHYRQLMHELKLIVNKK